MLKIHLILVDIFIYGYSIGLKYLILVGLQINNTYLVNIWRTAQVYHDQDHRPSRH